MTGFEAVHTNRKGRRVGAESSQSVIIAQQP